MNASLPTDAKDRKSAPMAEGLLWYFPNALAAVAAVSKKGNDQHNPGQPMHHARGKSMDHADCIIRHLVDSGTMDTDGVRHSAKVAWRALALLQEELEREEGAPLARNAVVVPPPPSYNPADVAFRKATLDELAAESQAWGMYDTIDTSAEPVDESPDLRHIGIGDVPKAGRIVPIAGGAKAEYDVKMEFDVRCDRRDDRTNFGTAADTAYLARFGPNVGSAASGIADISCDGRGNVALSGHARRKTDGAVADVRYSATNAAIPQHPMAAEVLRFRDEPAGCVTVNKTTLKRDKVSFIDHRDHDERLSGPEDRL